MVRLQLSFAGENQVDRQLARFSDRAADASPAFEAIADQVAAQLLRNFSTQGRHASGGWSPLSPRYARWKAKRYPGAPILVRTGKMRRELTRRPFGVERIGAQSMEVGTNLARAGYHQRGGGHLPRRRPFEFREATRREMAKVLQRFIVTGKVT